MDKVRVICAKCKCEWQEEFDPDAPMECAPAGTVLIETSECPECEGAPGDFYEEVYYDKDGNILPVDKKTNEC